MSRVIAHVMGAVKSRDDAESSTIESTHFTGSHTVEPLVARNGTVI
jgi:hypothetical protein